MFHLICKVMEDINKKANEDELNKAHEEIGKTPRKFTPVPKSKNQNENGEQKSNPSKSRKGNEG